MKKIILTILMNAVALCMTVSAYAAPAVSQNRATGNIEITGVEKNTKNLVVEVVEKQLGEDKRISKEIIQNIVYFSNPDAEILVVPLSVENKSEYTVKVNAVTFDKVYETDIVCYNPGKIKEIFDIMSAEDSAAADIRALLDDAQVRDILKMDDVAYQQMSDDGKAEFAKALKAQKPGTIEQFASFYDEKFLYYAANYSQNTAEGKRIIDKLYHRDALGGDDYENMTEKEMVAKRLAGKGALDKDSFLKEFSKAVFLTRLENTVGIADTNQLLVKYKSLLEGAEAYFSLSNTYAADKAIAGKSYATIEDCVKAINSAISGGTKSPSGTGGGKSGNGAILNTNLDMSEQNTSDSNAEIFEDLGNVPWAKEAILALYKKGILSGDGNGRFRPEDTIKREEFVKLLTLAFECEVSGGELPFDDVKKEQWYYPYILSGYTKKIDKRQRKQQIRHR